MNIFPVTASTLSATALVEYVKEKYILNKNCICILFILLMVMMMIIIKGRKEGVTVSLPRTN